MSMVVSEGWVRVLYFMFDFLLIVFIFLREVC